MDKSKFIEILYEIADILEMQNVPWKPRAYKQAARTLDGLNQDLEEIGRAHV